MSDALRKALRWSWLFVLVAFLYAGLTIYLRSENNKAIDDAAARERAEKDRRVYEQLGAGDLKIVTFYPNPPVISRGETGKLCYGVANATAVRIEPEVEPIAPALSRCIEVKPRGSTAYTLTATDSTGRTATKQVEVVVR
jgi:hypothetical protein